MKKLSTVFVIVFFLAAAVLSFFVGDYLSDKEHREDRVQRCGRYISFAIDTVEDKGLSVEGASEAIASNIWVAHELCDNHEIASELNDLWNTLVYHEEKYIGREDALEAQLKDILQRCQ